MTLMLTRDKHLIFYDNYRMLYAFNTRGDLGEAVIDKPLKLNEGEIFI